MRVTPQPSGGEKSTELIPSGGDQRGLRVLLIFGTRPEAIKMAPVYRELKRGHRFDVRVCVTAQHRSMLDQVLNLFEITPDFDLNLMLPDQNLADLTAGALQGLHRVLLECEPAVVLVQGDTTTTMAASMAAFYQKIPVGHVEAGLRTGNRQSPWPEELNRTMTTLLSDFHFAPTETARKNLLEEHVAAERIFVTGNTVVDALLEIKAALVSNAAIASRYREQFRFLNGSRKLILVTGHRRESFGAGIRNVCEALLEISYRPDVELVYPVHLNPNIRGPVTEMLSGRSNIHLIDPLDYLAFVSLMDRAYLILTDSGGIQEEAVSLKKPVLVMRDTTERPEGITAGTARLVGTDTQSIVRNVRELLEGGPSYQRMQAEANPYGDGTASRQIAEILARLLGTARTR